MLRNTENSYGFIAKLLHWIIALMILGLLMVGFIMESMEPSEQKWQLYGYHKATGFTIFILVTIRIVWRLINIEVLLPQDLPHWQVIVSKITHYLLYLFMFLMPFSGIMMSRLGGHNINVFDLFTIPAAAKNPELAGIFHKTHGLAAYGILAFILLHIGAALYHHFIRKDNVLMRMIR